MPYTTYSKQHLPLITHFHLGESAALYLAHTIRTLALALIGIYLPIYIFQLPHNVSFVGNAFLNGVFWILLYFLIRSIAVIIFTVFLSGIIFSRLNFKGSLFLSTFFLGIKILLWSLASKVPLLIFLAAIVGAVTIVFYWIPFHIFFIRKTADRDGHYGDKVGWRFFLAKIANVAGPALGGVVIATLGFNPLFLLSILLIVISVFPILVSVSEGKHHPHNVRGLVTAFLFNSKTRKISVSLIGRSVDDLIYTIFWPILLFVVLKSFVKIGFLTSFSILASSLTVLWVGKRIDHYGSKLVHGWGVFWNTIFYLFRAFLQTPLVVYAIDIVDRVNGAFYSVPFMSETYEKAKRLGEADFIIYRALLVHLTYAVILILGLILLPLLPNWQWIFLLAAVGSAFTYFMTLDKN